MANPHHPPSPLPPSQTTIKAAEITRQLRDTSALINITRLLLAVNPSDEAIQSKLAALLALKVHLQAYDLPQAELDRVRKEVTKIRKELMKLAALDPIPKRNAAGNASTKPSVPSSSGLENYFASPVVTLLVGSQSKPLYAHRNLLTSRCSYFTAAFARDTFRESTTGELHLPEEDPHVISIMLSWIYLGSGALRTMMLSGKLYSHLPRLYITADKFCMEAFKNELMDITRSTYLRDPGGIIKASFAIWMYENTMPDSPMRLWLARQYAWECRHNAGRSMKQQNEVENKGYKELLNCVDKGGDLATDIFKAMMERQGYSESVSGNPARDDDCVYHEHRDTPKCEGKTGVGKALEDLLMEKLTAS